MAPRSTLPLLLLPPQVTRSVVPLASRHMGKIAVGGGLTGVLAIVGVLVYLAENQ